MSASGCETEKKRRKARVAAGETDRARWESATSYEVFWAHRAAAAARLFRAGEWICDIGCGEQRLRAMLPAGCVYLPADLRQWDAAVEPCDLNAGILPKRHLARCDVAALLGVIEYIYDLPRLFDSLGRWAETMVISYNCSDLADLDRTGFGWVNTLTEQALLACLKQAGFNPDTVQRFGATEILVRAGNSDFNTIRRARRRVARRLYKRP